MSQSKRRNYLIDKPFQLGFIFKYLVVILITVLFCFGVTAIYFYYDNLFGDNKLNETVIIKYNGPNKTDDGLRIQRNGRYELKDHDERMLTVFQPNEYEKTNTYVVFRPYSSNMDEQYAPGSLVEFDDSEKAALKTNTGPQERTTQRFFIVIFPLIYTSLMIMLIITIYSLFFSHRMAGPVYRLRISLDLHACWRL